MKKYYQNNSHKGSKRFIQDGINMRKVKRRPKDSKYKITSRNYDLFED